MGEGGRGGMGRGEGGGVNLVLSWDFSANQNRAFYMQRSANLI